MCAVSLQRSDNRRRGGYATTATAARRLRDGWADGPVPLVLVSPCAPRGIGCGNVGISRAGREFHVRVDTVLWCPSGRHVHSRRPVAQRDRSHPSRETHPCARADHRAWAPGTLTMTPHHRCDSPKSLLCLTGFQTGSAKSSGRSLEHGSRRRGARDERDRARVHLRGGIARRSCLCGQPPTAKSAMRRLRHEDHLASFVN